MPKIINQTKVLSITSDNEILEYLTEKIGAKKDYEFIDSSVFEDEIIEIIDSIQPNCILLDYNNDLKNSINLIESITLQFPNIAIIIILDKDQLENSSEVLIAGAKAFLLKPIDAKKMFDTFNRIRDLQNRTKTTKNINKSSDLEEVSQGTVVVFSPKGGVGVSSVAVNLAISINEQLNSEVLLIDGKLLFGHLDILLNLRTLNSINDLLPHVGSLDEGLIRDVVAKHVSGINLLPSPKSILSGQGIEPETIFKLIVELQKVFPFNIIDGGNYLNENTVTYMDISDKVILILNPEITSLKDANQFLEVCKTLNYPKDKIEFVLNKTDKKSGLSQKEIEKTLQIKFIGTIPLVHYPSVQSINDGIPATLQRKRSPLRQAYKDLAKTILKKININQSQNKSKNISKSYSLSDSSRLG